MGERLLSVPFGPLYLESLGVAIFARGAHLAHREGQAWAPAAVTGYDRRIQRAVDMARANLAGSVTLTAMAGAAAVSPFRFLRVLKAATGETPHDFVARLRVERARAPSLPCLDRRARRLEKRLRLPFAPGPGLPRVDGRDARRLPQQPARPGRLPPCPNSMTAGFT